MRRLASGSRASAAAGDGACCGGGGRQRLRTRIGRRVALDRKAGAHPDFIVDFRLKTDPASKLDSNGLHEPYARTSDISVALPRADRQPELGGDSARRPVRDRVLSAAAARMPRRSASPKSRLYSFNSGTDRAGLQHGDARGGTVARLGFYASTCRSTSTSSVRSDSDYGLTANVEGIDATEKLVTATTTLWGVPAAAVHDTQRQTPREAFDGVSASPPRPPGAARPAPFLVNPTRCGVPLGISISSRQLPGTGPVLDCGAPLPTITGCDDIDFDPASRVTPTTREAAAPTGLDAELTIPQNETVDGQATSHCATPS